jgi:hypothetical protein
MARDPRPSATPPLNDTHVLRSVIQMLEQSPGSLHSLDDLANVFSARRRVLYDFVSVCAVFDICRRVSNTTMEWYGLARAHGVIDQFRTQIAIEGDSPDILTQFHYSIDPSLQRIAVGIVKLFFYLNLKFLDLRKVGRFFGHGQTKMKTMLRKLYIVVGILEVAGIVIRTAVSSEIQLSAPLHETVTPAKMGLSLLLNSPDELLRAQDYERRRKVLEMDD